MHNGRKLLVIIGLAFSLLGYSQTSFARNVLVIWGADYNQPWTAAVSNALEQSLTASQAPVTLYSESLSYDRLRVLPNPRVWATHLNQKYANAQIDLVIAFEHGASLQLHAAFDDLLPLAEKFSILGNGELTQIATVGQDISFSNHIEHLDVLLPNTQQHLVISSLPSIKGEAGELAQLDSRIELFTDDRSYDELFAQVEALPENSVITYAVMHRDAQGDQRNPRAVLQELLQRSKVPLFVKHSTLLLPGVVGGHTLDANKVAQLMLAALQSDDPSSASLYLGSLSLDVAELNRWNIPLNRVPTEARLYNEPLTFWQDHKSQLFWMTGLLLATLLVIGVLTSVLRQRNNTLRISEQHREASAQLQREAEARLAAEQDKLDAEKFSSLALESAYIGAYKYDAKTGSMWLSPVAAATLGVETDAAGLLHDIKNTLLVRIHPDDLSRLQSEYDPNTSGPESLTYRIRDKAGEIRWINSISDSSSEAGAFTRIGVIRDTTDGHELTDRLLRAQERMTLALEAACIDLFEIETESGVALPLTNGRGLFQIGQRFDFVEGISTQQLPKSTREELSSVIRQENRTFEFTESNSVGTKHRWIQVVTGRFYRRNDTEYLTLVYTDITHLRQHEYAAFRHSQENELALSASGAGVATIHPATGRTQLSARAQEVWDTGPLANDATSLMTLAEQYHPEDDGWVRAKFREMLSGADIGSQEYRIRLRSGEYRWIRAFGRTHYDINGTAEVIAVFYDIDAEKRQFELVEEARERQSRLFAIIGHELRTPIATIKMMLEEQGVYELAPYGKQTQETIKHTLSVLDDLRSVTQPQQHVHTETPASPYEQLEQALGSLGGLLETHNIRPHFLSNPESQTLCLLDRQSLRQMITNLIKNAAVHSGASDIWLTLEAEPQPDERMNLKISLSDNGKGIPEAEIETLFEPFRRGDTQADGTGLGLHICRDLAQRMSGTLTYEASAQGGAKFNFNASFRLARQVETQVELHTEAQAQVLPLKGMQVLYAEDQKTLQMLTTVLLKKQGAEVVLANDGNEALELFKRHTFDFVLTDIMMPNLDGYGLTRALREQGYTHPIIGLTAATIGLETDELLLAGADVALSKPVDIQKLLEFMTEAKTKGQQV